MQAEPRGSPGGFKKSGLTAGQRSGRSGTVVGTNNPMRQLCLVLAAAALPLSAQKPFQSQSPTSAALTIAADGEQTLDIVNSAFELTGTGIPGRPADQHLLLRTVTRSKAVIGDIGVDATTAVDAWPLGTDPAQKPLYTVKATGDEARTIEGEVLVISRGLEEIEWWSVYKLGTGEHLFDTYVPLIHFSISRETVTNRYVGIQVPEETKDAQLVSTVTYASPERVRARIALSSDDPKQAALLRSLADTTRTVAWSGGALHIVISQNYPSAANTVAISIPIVKDDLDLAHAQLPPHLHLAKR